MTPLDRAFRGRQLDEPAFLRSVFANTALAPLWLVARVYLGYQWLIAGWAKAWGDDRWIAVNGHDGLALRAQWERATAMPEEGQPPIAFDWYRDFLRFLIDHDAYTWLSWVVAVGEVALGLALIIGACTGVAALLGATMTFNLQIAGAASVNPVLFVIAVLIMFGWKVAGWIGIDRWLLPAIGAPWEGGPREATQPHPDSPSVHSQPT
jgi:thiosulfate dehydrogenase [quinone] large subunit